MSVRDESAAGWASVQMGPSLGVAAAELGDVHRARPAARSIPSRTPMTVADLAVQWSVLEFDQAEIARSCCEQVAIRVAAGWPEWATEPEQVDLVGVMRELAYALHLLVDQPGRHHAEEHVAAAARSADVKWLKALRKRLVRAGWMSGSDRSEPAVVHAVNVAVLDCRLAQQLAPIARSMVVELGVIQLTF